MDGLENILTTEDFSSLTKEKLDSFNLKTGKIISTSEECGKIVNNFECYIASVLRKRENQEMKVGTKAKIRLSSGKELDTEVSYVSEENDEMIVIFKLNELPDELINYRKISFDIVWWSYSGLKVPNQAIAQENDKNYVVRNRAGYLSKLLVKVLKQNEKYSIVTTYTTDELKDMGYSNSEINSYKKITLYDEILLNPDLGKVK